jgi:hypothetical protein
MITWGIKKLGNDQEVEFHEIKIRLFHVVEIMITRSKVRLGKVRLGLEFDLMKNCNFDLMKTGKIIMVNRSSDNFLGV